MLRCMSRAFEKLLRTENFDLGASRPAHTSTAQAGFNYVHPQDRPEPVRRIVGEGTKTLSPDVPLYTHQHRLVQGTLDHIRDGGVTSGAPDPLVRIHPDGRHWVMDGHHRLAVAREQGKSIKVGYQQMGY